MYSPKSQQTIKAQTCERKTKALKNNIKEPKTTTASIQKENTQLNNAVLELKCRSMRNNIIISGLEEDEEEDSTITEQKVITFLKDSENAGR